MSIYENDWSVPRIIIPLLIETLSSSSVFKKMDYWFKNIHTDEPNVTYNGINSLYT